MIKQALEKILNEWPVETQRAFRSNQLASYIRSDFADTIRSHVLSRNPHLIVQGSAGAGNWASIPWLAIMDPSITQTTRHGVYPVYLFRADASGVYISLGQGVTNLREKYGAQKAKELMKSMAIYVREKIGKLDKWIIGPTDLRSTTSLGKSFEAPNIAAKLYERGQIPSDDILKADLDELVLAYGKVASSWPGENAYESVLNIERGDSRKTEPDNSFSVSGKVDKGELTLSMLTNAFVIITGTSGSGKTRLARRIAMMLGAVNRSFLIPVGADWTDNRHVLGYVNHLVRDKENDRPIYQTTPIVKLLLAANGDSDHPYFLILDEMNLSHVERYFADFLSKMESRDEIMFHSEDGPLKGSDGVEVPASIPCVPPNLFVIGTVNVDETTYMFSPKVLDRAQVIEFRVSPEEAQAYLETESGVNLSEPKPDEEAGRAFLELSLRARGLRQPALPDSDHVDMLKTALGALFEMMHGWRMEFAYRTMNEVLRYARVSYELAENKVEWSWQACLDTQILQKVLPKLHGNKKRLEPVLMGLTKFCESGRPPDTTADYKTDLSSTSAVGRLAKPKEGEVDPVVFRSSYEKLCDMLDAVRRDQYVSFIQ